jgi:hypothetical protein
MEHRKCVIPRPPKALHAKRKIAELQASGVLPPDPDPPKSADSKSTASLASQHPEHAAQLLKSSNVGAMALLRKKQPSTQLQRTNYIAAFHEWLVSKKMEVYMKHIKKSPM